MPKPERKMKMRNKAQMEIMGLVVIVLLVTVAMFFVITFVVFGEDESSLAGYTQTQTAAHFLSTMRKTTTPCDSMSIEQLIQACATNPQRKCSGNGVCTYLDGVSEYLLMNTLVEWGNKPFYFSIYSNREEMTYFRNKECDEDSPGMLKQEFIPTSSGIVTLEMKICDR